MSLTTKIFLFLISLNFLYSINLQAMEPAKPPVGRKILLAVPPQCMEAINEMQRMEALYPQIAQEKPSIRSQIEFDLAKQYVDLTKQYNALLVAGAMYGSARNEANIGLLQNSEQVLKGLQTYIETLQGPSCHAFRSPEDQKAFEREIYDIHYQTAQNHLLLLIKFVLVPGNNSSAIHTHVQAINKIKEKLSGDAEYRKKLQQAINNAEEMIPAVRSLFHPQSQGKHSQPVKAKSKRIEQQRTVKYYQKVSDGIPNGLLQGLESFDAYFQITSLDILTEYLALSVKKLSPEDYVGGIQKLTDDCVSLEKKGVEFKAFLPGPKPPSQSESLTSDELADLYGFFCQRYTTSNKSPLQLLDISIFMFIQANKIEEALNRTEALSTLLLQKGPLSDRFISLRASVMALNGDSEEWRKIIEDKRNRSQNEKVVIEQKKVSQIKKQQEKTRKEQEAIDEALKKNPPPIPVKKNTADPIKRIDSFEDMHIFAGEEPKPEPELIAPREKIKTRKAPQEPDDQVMPFKDKKELSLETEEPPRARKEYVLSKPAFKTYQKIRRGDWKFPRNDLYNLFDKLGCKVDMEQGKGDHGTIPLPLTMTIYGAEGVVAVLPEFTQTQSENRPPRPITVPNWDEKWDGRVPPYMRKSILRALDYLDATDETVRK